VREQLEELTTIVNDLVELARDGERPGGFGQVRLDHIVAMSVEAFRRHARGVEIRTELLRLVESQTTSTGAILATHATTEGLRREEELDVDMLIVGGGTGGMCLAHGLKRAGISA
jgi:hypothetical protein